MLSPLALMYPSTTRWLLMAYPGWSAHEVYHNAGDSFTIACLALLRGDEQTFRDYLLPIVDIGLKAVPCGDPEQDRVTIDAGRELGLCFSNSNPAPLGG